MDKKQKSCDPADPDDDHCGEYRDHVRLRPRAQLVLAVVPGARTEDNACEIVAEVKDRFVGRQPGLMTSDAYPAYASAIEETFGAPDTALPRRQPGRPRIVPGRRLQNDLIYAAVHQRRENNRVIAVEPRQVFG